MNQQKFESTREEKLLEGFKSYVKVKEYKVT